MRFSHLFLLFIYFVGLGNIQGQESADTLRAKDNVMIPLPTVSLNFGFNHLMSDVKLSDGPSPFQQFGYQLSITQRATKFLNVTLDLYTGTVYGEEQRNQTNLNFRTTLFSQHLNVEYNFYPLLKPDANGKQLIRPYIGLGVGAIFFRSKGDLNDGFGNEYNYWSDGLIYAETEGSVNQSEATPLTRDFEYETDLRDANLDGLRKYSQTAFSLPINAGIRFQITKNVGVNAAFAYALNFSDMIDNVSEIGSGDRLGSSGNDNHLFGSIGLSVFLGQTKPSAKPKPTFEENLATKEEIKELEVEPAPTEENDSAENENKNDLASISERLIKASESITLLSQNSEAFLSKKSNELNEITNRDIQSKKALREAKKESIAVLDSSMASLQLTGTGLVEATGELNSAHTEFTDKKFDTRPSTATKVKNTIEAKIPAIESLKAQVENAKSAEELKAILNISSKNLTHANDIFKNESTRINQSISKSRKEVLEARVEQLVSTAYNVSNEQGGVFDSEIGTTTAIKDELEELMSEGVLSQLEYNQLMSTTATSETTILAHISEEIANQQAVTSNTLASTTESLTKSSKDVIQKVEAANQSLIALNQELLSLTQREPKTKGDLNRVKQQAIKLLEQTSFALIETSQSFNTAESNLVQADSKLPKENVTDSRLSSPDKIQTAIDATLPFLEASKAKIQLASSSADLNQLLVASSEQIKTTSELIANEKSQISLATLKARKEIAISRIQSLSYKNSIDPVDLESIAQEVEILRSAKILSKQENDALSDGLAALKASPILDSTNELTEAVSSDDEPITAIQKSSTDEKNKTEGNDDVVAVPIKTTSKPRTVEEIENTPPKLSGGFHWADVNQNGWISPDEVLHFIDLLFEGEPLRSVEDIQNLIDYYFDQE